MMSQSFVSVHDCVSVYIMACVMIPLYMAEKAKGRGSSWRVAGGGAILRLKGTRPPLPDEAARAIDKAH